MVEWRIEQLYWLTKLDRESSWHLESDEVFELSKVGIVQSLEEERGWGGGEGRGGEGKGEGRGGKGEARGGRGGRTVQQRFCYYKVTHFSP